MAALTRYQVDEVSFEVPDDYADESINVLMTASASAPLISVVVTREPRSSDPLPQQVVSILKRAEETLPGLRLLGHRPCEVGSTSGYEARAQGFSHKKPTYQRQIYAAWYGTLLCLTLTAPRASAPRCDAVAAEILDSLKLRKRS
jgi:hypothetical protein